MYLFTIMKNNEYLLSNPHLVQKPYVWTKSPEFAYIFFKDINILSTIDFLREYFKNFSYESVRPVYLSPCDLDIYLKTKRAKDISDLEFILTPEEFKSKHLHLDEFNRSQNIDKYLCKCLEFISEEYPEYKTKKKIILPTLL